jgi:hypothetical protein
MGARFIALTAKQRAKGFFNESRKTGKLTALALDAPQRKQPHLPRKNANNKREVQPYIPKSATSFNAGKSDASL